MPFSSVCFQTANNYSRIKSIEEFRKVFIKIEVFTKWILLVLYIDKVMYCWILTILFISWRHEKNKLTIISFVIDFSIDLIAWSFFASESSFIWAAQKSASKKAIWKDILLLLRIEFHLWSRVITSQRQVSQLPDTKWQTCLLFYGI